MVWHRKLMLRRFSSQQILLMMYFGCLLVFTPVAEFSQVREPQPVSVWLFGLLLFEYLIWLWRLC